MLSALASRQSAELETHAVDLAQIFSAARLPCQFSVATACSVSIQVTKVWQAWLVLACLIVSVGVGAHVPLIRQIALNVHYRANMILAAA